MEKINILIAILAIAGLAAFAVSQGINGVLVGAAFTILGGLGGFEIARIKKKSKP